LNRTVDSITTTPPVTAPAAAADSSTAIVLAMFAASGASALIYEVAWMRQLADLLGSTSSAAAAVLATFMGGLAIGSLAIGRIVDRVRRPLVVFALLEAAVAAAALVLPMAFDAAVPLYRWLYALSGEQGTTLAVSQFIISSVLLLVPTVLMGGTLPALVRATVSSGSVGRGTARLYAVNTLGATIGAVVAGFYLIPSVGLRMTIALAAALNVVNGVVAWRTRESGAQRAAPAPAAPTARSDGDLSHRRPAMAGAVLLAVAASGFTSLASEVAWTRILVFGLGSTTYAFAAMLATYLAGLSIGAFAATRLANRVARPVRAAATVQGLAGAVSVASLFVYLRYADRITATLFTAAESSWLNATLLGVCAAAVALGPATLLMGAAFPLMCEAYGRGRAALGSAIGRLYAANTIAAVGGSLVAAFVLIPRLGLVRTVLLLAAASLCSAATLLAVDEPHRSGVVRASIVLVAALRLVTFPLPAPLHHVGPTERLVFYKEGRLSTVSVVEDAGGMRKLYIDKIAVAGTDPVLLTDQKSLAHVPMLLRPQATRALTVGFGSGGASWSFTRYSRLKRVDCVEIDPTVLEAAPLFAASHHGVVAHPRFHVVLEDARSYLAATRETYDIISTDCTDLRYKSNASLYTREYFTLCRRRLNRGGLVAVWLPLGGLATDDLRVALSTFVSVFPHASLWYMNNVPAHYALLVGTDEDITFDAGAVAEQLGEPAVYADLAEIGLADRWKLFGSFVTSGAGVARLASNAPVNTDDRPILEFSVPRNGFRGSIAQNLLALVQERHPPQLANATERERQEASRYWRSAGLLVEGHAVFLKGNYEYGASIARYRVAAAVNADDRDIPQLIGRMLATRQAKANELEAVVAVSPDDARARNDLGLVWLSGGDAARALREFERASTLEPDDWGFRFNRGVAAERSGDLDGAALAYGEAIARNPAAAGPHTNLGLLFLSRGRADAGLMELEKAATLEPRSADAVYNVGVAYQALHRDAEAIAAYQRAIGLRSTHAAALTNLGIIFRAHGRTGDARRVFERAVEADPGYPEAHYNFGLLLDAADRTSDARRAYETAVRLRPDYAEAHNNLGILNDRDGDRAAAIGAYRRALAARPSYAEAHVNLALALVAVNRPVDAKAEAERAVALQPSMAQAHVSLGLASSRLGDRAAAVRAFERALTLDPGLRGVPALLAQARTAR
jgi:spermidine synthase